ncbi:MAG TPA: ABC transporter permease [Acidimicrobiales bacterium]|nr:ABC transporter permease [Acidimicrobiales bacterium]
MVALGYLGNLLRRTSYAGFGTVVFVGMLIANVALDPALVKPGNLASTVQALAPLVLVAMGMTPAVLSGRGGIDLSLGPLAGFVTVLLAGYLNHGWFGTLWVIVPTALAAGFVVGVVNGWIIAGVRIQPIVATLGTYLVLTGLGQQYVPNNGGTLPPGLNLGGSWAGIPSSAVVLVLAWLAWFGVTRLRYHRLLLAVGQDDRGAYSAGTSVARVRIVAYGIGGVFAGLAGLVLTSLISGGDASIGPSYTLVAIAAVALGGTSLAGGRGGMFGSVIGALDIYLIQNVLSLLNLQVFYVNLVYGLILIAVVTLNRVVTVRIGTARRPLERSQATTSTLASARS